MNREKKKPYTEYAVRRGEIYYADLDPVIGSEQGGKRLVVVIQNDIGNYHSPTVIVASMTSKMDKTQIPTHILVQKSESRLRHNTFVLLEQIRTIDCSRLKGYIGCLDDIAMLRIDKALAIGFGIDYLLK